MSEAENSVQQGEPISGNLALCAFVSKSHLFRKVAPEDMGAVYEAGRLFLLEPNKTIIRECDSGDMLFLLVKGNVKMLAKAPTGQVELERLSRGAIFGEVSFLTGKPRTASVVTLDKVEVVGFARDGLDAILKKYPKVRKLIQTMMAGRAEKAIEKITTCVGQEKN